MEVNALFANGKTIKPAARAFADFLLRELRAAEDGSGQRIAVTARHSLQLLTQYLYPTLAENLTLAKHAPQSSAPALEVLHALGRRMRERSAIPDDA
jgi:hypothetical protein